MTDTITRRTALAGAAALPLAPTAALGANEFLWDLAHCAPEDQQAICHLGRRMADGAGAGIVNATDPVWPEYLAAEAARDALDAEFRAGIDHFDEESDAIMDRYNPAADAVIEAPVATLTDVERKLRAVVRSYEDSNLPDDLVLSLLAQVRAATGRAAA